MCECMSECIAIYAFLQWIELNQTNAGCVSIYEYKREASSLLALPLSLSHEVLC